MSKTPPESPVTATSIPAAVGTRLGHYILLKRLGAGGMGQVYEARDQSLERLVAIKILLPEDTTDEAARRRFQREAQSASSLNHPNIVTVYEAGRQGDLDFLVMERIAGRTLDEVIGNKGIPIPEAVRYARQISDALAAAHRIGIVHRDLKPRNVMVTDTALIKVLDFGLAKKLPAEREAASDAVTESYSSSLTGHGVVVGTGPYMSPEQVEAKEVDARSDIFSFGSLLYEMLTGRRAFPGHSQIATAAAVLAKEPEPLRGLVSDVPPLLQRVIDKCLEKRAEDRWQNIGDVKLLLDELSGPGELVQATTGRLSGWPGVALAGITGILVSGLVFWMLRAPRLPAGPEPVTRMVTADAGLSAFPALSKDGKLIAFASDRGGGGNLDIWLHQIGGREPIRLTRDPEDEIDPAFSPDGTRIAFRSEKNGGGIYVVPTLGGQPTLLARGGRNPRYSPDGKLVAYWSGGEGVLHSGVYVIDAGGGTPRQLNAEAGSIGYPVWSPSGGELMVFARNADATEWLILPVQGGAPKNTGVMAQLTQQKLNEVGSVRQMRLPLDWRDQDGGRLIFAAGLGDATNLWEIGLSSSGKVSGPAQRLTRGPGLHTHVAWAIAQDVERMAYSNEALNFDIWKVPLNPKSGEAEGGLMKITEGLTPELAPSITGDGTKLAFVRGDFGSWALEMKELASGKQETLLTSPVRLVNARLTGDGNSVVYSNADYNIFSVPVGGGAVEKLCERCGTVMGVSADGKLVTYEPSSSEDLMGLDPERNSIRLAGRQSANQILSSGKYSRDVKWVAFHSLNNSTSTAQVWIAQLNGKQAAPTGQWIAITDGKSLDRDPAWSPNERLLYFTSDRDGFRCVWARRLDAASKKPEGDAFAVQHLHTARRSLRRIGNTGFLTGLSVGGNSMVFALGELTGNIWLEEKSRAK